MNRTNEYNHIISSFATPQKQPPTQFIENPLASIQDDISELSLNLSKFTHSKIRSMINSIETRIKNCEELPMKYGQCKFVNESIAEYIINTKNFAKLSLQRIKDLYAARLKNETEKRKVYCSEDGASASNKEGQFILQEQENIIQRENILQERIEDQITEIGQIFTDITLQIHAQGETLRRIDDMMVVNEGYLRNSDFNIRRTWDKVKGTRHGIIVYFIFWILILFVIFLFKKIFS